MKREYRAAEPRHRQNPSTAPLCLGRVVFSHGGSRKHYTIKDVLVFLKHRQILYAFERKWNHLLKMLFQVGQKPCINTQQKHSEGNRATPTIKFLVP